MSRQARHAAVIAATSLLVAACAGEAEEDVAATTASPPTQVDEVAPEVDTTDLRLPFQLQGLVVVDPGWDDLPVHHDGIFVGPVDDGPQLQFTAVDTEGTILWRSARPPECASYAVSSTTDGTAIVVLSDNGGEAAADCTTVHAYELGTGDPVWGPVEVPGRLVGPGLTFQTGEEAGRAVLSADTGDLVPAPDGSAWLGEFHGSVLRDDGDMLTAEDMNGEELWSRAWPRAEHEQVGAAPDLGSPSLAAVGSVETGYDLVSLTDGDVLAEGIIDVDTDAATGFTVAVGASRLQGFDAEGQPAWAVSVSSDLRIHTAGGGLVYLSDGTGLQVHNVSTGAAAVGYDDTSGTLATPEITTVAGAGVVRTPRDLFLVTNRPAEGAGP